MGIVGMFSYLTAAMVPHSLTLMSSLVDGDQVWPALFILVSAVCVLANIIFIIFGTADTQDWNDVRPECQRILNIINYGINTSDEKLAKPSDV